MGKGGGNTPGTDLPVVAGPSLARYKVIIDQLPRLPTLEGSVLGRSQAISVVSDI